MEDWFPGQRKQQREERVRRSGVCEGEGGRGGVLRVRTYVSHHRETLGRCLFTSGHKQVSLFVNRS